MCAFADYMRHAIAHVFTVVSVIELFSSSLHERALTRLAVAHDLASPGEHSSCRDWFECLLRTKAALSQQECPSQGELSQQECRSQGELSQQECRSQGELSQQECRSQGELNYFNSISLLNFVIIIKFNVINVFQAGGVKIWYIVFLCRVLSTGHPQ